MNNKAYKFFTFIFSLSLVISLFLLLSRGYEEYSQEQKFERIRESKIAVKEEETTALVEKGTESISEKTIEKEEESFEEHSSGNKWFESISVENNDIMSWIKLEEAGIDYPVMYSDKDREFYLRRSFDKDYSLSGTPFFDIRTPLLEEKEPNINIIYGHNMRNGTMFSNLRIYEKLENIEKSEDIILETKAENLKYKIFASLVLKEYTKLSDQVYSQTSFKDKAEYDNYMNMIRDNCLEMLEDVPNYGDDILVLSTCSDRVERGRLVVFAIRQ